MIPIDANPRRVRRISIWIFFVLFLLTIAPYAIFLSTDAELPDDRDLLPGPRIELPDAKNGYRHAVAIGEALPQQSLEWLNAFLDHPTVDASTLTLDLTQAAKWPGSPVQKFAHDLLATTSEALGGLDRALTELEWSVGNVDDVGEELPAIRRFSSVLDLQIQVALIEGRPFDAAEDALRLVRLGVQLQKASVTRIGLLVGTAFERKGLDHLRKICASAEVGADELARILEALLPLEVPPDPLLPALREEYAHARQQILDQGKRFTFKPHRTLSAVAEDYRSWLKELEKPYLDQRTIDEGEKSFFAREMAILSGNALGETWRQTVNLHRTSFSRQMRMTRLDRDVTRVVLALQLYRFRVGSLPSSLDLLIEPLAAEPLTEAPLTEIPCDPFDGNAIRYDPRSGTIWSIGSDGIDAGGLLAPNLSHPHEEPIYRVPPPPNSPHSPRFLAPPTDNREDLRFPREPNETVIHPMQRGKRPPLMENRK